MPRIAEPTWKQKNKNTPPSASARGLIKGKRGKKKPLTFPQTQGFSEKPLKISKNVENARGRTNSMPLDVKRNK